MDVAIHTAVGMPERALDLSQAIGMILVEQGRLASEDADRILRFAVEREISFCDAGMQLDLLTQDDVMFALAEQSDSPVLPQGGPDGISSEVIAGYNPYSALVEPLRLLRTQLMLRWYHKSSRRVLSVVSPERAEGRSWLVANLATAFAQIGLRTLIVDADLRQPRQHEMFNLNGHAGLCELLRGRAGGDAVQRIHPQLRLFVLSAGSRPPDPQELLSRPVFDLVIDRFAEQFDLVLIDTPATSQSADAQIIAAQGGSALVLARQNHTRSTQMGQTMKGFAQIGVNIVGSIISDH